ncbi:sensor histidine kinase [Alkalimonas mucilaginosa]|uniref:HAMP domain-containing sensor histidine kinase n=1 Tax=Alkalimonas mucilaginosa TaxID=3057676 RepID=A0ABU7JDR0_9GAMM|nr:HAMP domain-containing sensor histidine kinase [Alkalimonas sp. MEB004]MEE2023831.1 HAMP domain-containing sensor histidine kinase [Alkalimonas sp. MEB004]
MAIEQDKLSGLSKTLFSISELSYADLAESTYFARLHQCVHQLVHCDNFMIVLYHPTQLSLEIAYFADQKDACPATTHFALGDGITSYVIRKRKPVLLDAEDIQELIQLGEIASVLGHLDSIASWLGVPMLLEDELLGVLVIQSYSSDVKYQTTDLELLAYVATHLAAHFERRKAHRERQQLMQLLAEKNQQLEKALHQLKKQELSLIQQQRMASFGKLAESLAHEINSPLGATLCNLQLLQHYVEILPKVIPEQAMEAITCLTPEFPELLMDAKQLVAETEAAASKIETVVKQLTLFHHHDSSSNTPVNVHTLLQSVALLLKSTHHQLIPVEIDCNSMLQLNTNKAKLVQVLFGLLENAMEHGKPPLKMQALLDESEHHVLLRVIDQGAGVAANLLQDLQHRQEMAKTDHKGLGLALCVHTVQELKGTLSLQPQHDGHTCFEVRLPL